VRGHGVSPESVRSVFGFKGVRRKKTARLAGGFSGILGVLRALTPLSIRQRSEMPKKVKVKLGGHGEMGWLVKRVSDFITRADGAVQAMRYKNAGNPHTSC
jgi:hypothetical protein